MESVHEIPRPLALSVEMTKASVSQWGGCYMCSLMGMMPASGYGVSASGALPIM
ncbi:MAG: hypothetical protein LKI98_06570 [Bifidobacterium crudilactis]|nr:hypothetical protein [Bifidobacterium crudilactis]MCI1890084.1 hypothetical protein [Bifidobacterium crudilactis]